MTEENVDWLEKHKKPKKCWCFKAALNTYHRWGHMQVADVNVLNI